jgi:DNA-binding SARP family transcriptional activator
VLETRVIPVEFRVLGPLAVVEDGRLVPLDRRRLRALLAFLLLHANELVSSDRLIDEVWGPEPPKTAGASLQNHVSRLRKAIGPDLIVSQPPGYVLRVDPEHFDLARFERLIAEARGAPLLVRAEKLRAALALWRGPALEDLAFEPFIRDEAGRLEEERLAALEERIDADLTLGAGRDIVVELEALIEEHPLRERFRRQLMLALYRGGRQAEALEAYQDARRVLMDELGLEPSEELRTLQQAILQQEPSLAPPEAAARGRPPDRRTVTVLFCDVVDSTKLAAELDPEVYRRLMSRYFELVRASIERHGGTLEKFIGDAVMAVFGVPDLHEDDALRAVRAADEAQAALCGEAWDVPLTARVGVSTGEVHVLSSSGDDLHISGAAASVAAGLEERAPPGGVLLAKETHRLVRDAVRAAPVGDAWRLDEVLTEAVPYTRHLDAALIGRAVELQRLHNAYENARDGRKCYLVTLVGEAGIGKTRLARELVASLREEARVLVGRCVSYGEGATYLPIAEIVRHAADENSLGGIRKLLTSEADADAVAERIAELAGVAETPAAPGEAFWAVRRFLEALSRTRPLLVVLDDIHWAEPTLLDLIEYLGHWAEGPILVVCLARHELLEARPAWGGPTSTGFLVELEPLPTEMLDELVAQLAVEPIEADIQQQIVDHAGGNPLFAEQLLAFAADEPELPLENPPPTVEALLASRIDRLEPRSLALLRRAAVLGRTFTSAQLEDLGSDPDAGRLLQSLTERRFVRPLREVFRFHHVLVRDVAYRGIPKTERAALHEQAARCLERRDGADEIVGYHFEQAFRYLTEIRHVDPHAHALAKAGGEVLGRAGIRAWKRADAAAAVSLLRRTLVLTPNEGDLACELALALNVRGDRARAQDLLMNVTAHADEHTRLRAELEHAFLRSLGEPGRAGELLDAATAAIPTLERAGDDRGLGRAWYCVAHVRGGFYCEYAKMEEAAERVGTYYSRGGWSTSAAAEMLGLALYFGPRPVDEAIARLDQLSVYGTGDPAGEANSALWLGGLESMRCNFEIARAQVGRAHTLYLDLGLTGGAVDLCGRALAAVELLAGFPEVAERALREACAFLQESKQTAVLATRAAELAAAIYERGLYDEAAVWAGLARESAGADDLDAALTRQPVEAKILARLGGMAEAERLARATLSLVAQTDALNRHADALLALAEILDLAGSEREARENARQALALYEMKGNTAAAARVRERLGGVTVSP